MGTDFAPVPLVTSRAGSLAEEEEEEEEEAFGLMLFLGASGWDGMEWNGLIRQDRSLDEETK